MREEKRKLLANGIDPAQKEAKSAETDIFEVVAREWHKRQQPIWTEGYATDTLARLEKDIFPFLGQFPIAQIKAPKILEVLRKVEDRGAIETAHRLKIACGQIFRYAIATGRAEYDPTAGLKGALSPRRKRHHAAITDPKEVAHLLRAFDDFQGYPVTKAALQLAPLLFVRPGELQKMEWAEIDFDAAEWNIPASKMKMRLSHLVPLPKQAIEILQSIIHLTGSSKYVFPNARSFQRPMSDMALLNALRRIGYSKEKMTAHGCELVAVFETGV